MDIPHFDHGGEGPPLHFLHANGYPPGCYEPLLSQLADHYHVFGMTLRPLWPDSGTEEVKDWRIFSRDLIQFLEDTGDGPVIGAGHSIGGIVTLRAALWNPEYFRALVLFDPVLFTPGFMVLWNLVRALGLGRRFHPLIPGALRRRRKFETREAAFQGYRSRSVFKYMNDEQLRIYVEGITRRVRDGFELIYAPEWEAHVYFTGIRDFDLWGGLPRFRLPTLILRGAETDTFSEQAAKHVMRRNPRIRIESLPASTHILPLERPNEVFAIMQSFLKEVV